MKKDKSSIQQFPVPKEWEGLRLDQFLTKSQVVKNRSQALKLISKNKVFLQNSNPKASYRVQPGDVFRLFLEETSSPETLSRYEAYLEILFEDEDILILNKPAGLVVHPAPGHREKTLVNILAHQKKLSPGSHPLRPGIVHRLDKGTSGLMLVTKNKISEKAMIKQFQQRKVKREYWALSLKAPSPSRDTLETWLKRHPVRRQKFISLKTSQKGGKKAITSYELFRQSEYGISWIKCWLKTGRTHQVRAHLSSLACPLVGDELYGGKKKLSFIKDSLLKEQIKNLNRIALHAHSLSFRHPLRSKNMSFQSPWPLNLQDILKNLGFL